MTDKSQNATTSLRLNTEHRKQLEKRLKRAGYTLSDWVRAAMLMANGPNEEATKIFFSALTPGSVQQISFMSVETEARLEEARKICWGVITSAELAHAENCEGGKPNGLCTCGVGMVREEWRRKFREMFSAQEVLQVLERALR